MTEKTFNKIKKFKIKAQFKTGYGARMKTLRGLTKSFIQYGINADHAICLVKIKHKELREGFNSGYVFSAAGAK